MTSEEAHKLNGLLVRHFMWEQATYSTPSDIGGLPLADLLEATRIVASEEPRNADDQGVRHLGMQCDPRYIAALYALTHYHALDITQMESGFDLETVALLPTKGLIVLDAASIVVLRAMIDRHEWHRLVERTMTELAAEQAADECHAKGAAGDNDSDPPLTEIPDANQQPIRVGDRIRIRSDSSDSYDVAELKTFPHGPMVGIYDEPPSRHVDFWNPWSLHRVNESPAL